jgi:hypothetical protein
VLYFSNILEPLSVYALEGLCCLGYNIDYNTENNMKINELTAKAFDKAIPYTWDSLDYLEVEKLLSVFAELIVRECIDTVQNGGGMCGVISSNNLKQHFGVE